MKKKWIGLVFVLLLVVVAVFTVRLGYFNMEHRFKGDLKSVLIQRENKETIEITKGSDMKKLEGIFFNKFAHFKLGFTKEAGLTQVIFDYEKEKLDFDVFIDGDKSYIKLGTVSKDYNLSSKDIERIEQIIETYQQD